MQHFKIFGSESIFDTIPTEPEPAKIVVNFDKIVRKFTKIDNQNINMNKKNKMSLKIIIDIIIVKRINLKNKIKMKIIIFLILIRFKIKKAIIELLLIIIIKMKGL